MNVWWVLQVSCVSVVELEKAEPTTTGNLWCVKSTIIVWANDKASNLKRIYKFAKKLSQQ